MKVFLLGEPKSHAAPEKKKSLAANLGQIGECFLTLELVKLPHFDSSRAARSS